MDHPKNYIVFLCYGHERVFFECAYAFLSLSRLYESNQLTGTDIWIYTDTPEWFSRFNDCSLPLNYRKLDDNTLRQWKGQNGFVHRAKIEALKDLAQNKKGNILYVDTDCVFMHNPDKMLHEINAGLLYMHTMEGIVHEEGTPLLKKLNKYLSKKNTNIDGKPLQERAMWNAGVLGFNTQHSGLLDSVLSFTDTIYPEFPKHIAEQFAFSVYFQQTGDIKSAAPYILHYWKLKEAEVIVSSFLEYFRNASWVDLTRYSVLIQMHVLLQEKADFFHNRNFLESLINKQWKPANTDWSQRLKQL